MRSLTTAGRGLIVEESGEVGVGGQPLQRRYDRRPLTGGAGPIDREVDEIGILRFAENVARHHRNHSRRMPHIGPAAHLACDQAAPLGLGIGAADRADCDVQFPGEIAMRRQLRPGGQPAASHILRQGLGNGAIARSVAARQIGHPICHGDKFMVDESFRSQFDLSRTNDEPRPMAHRDCIDTSLFPAAQYPRARRSASVGAEPVEPVSGWRERARSRHLLLQLDDRMLRDVGLSRSDVDRECAKHFWQP